MKPGLVSQLRTSVQISLTRQRVTYLLLSYLTGIVELGSVTYVIQRRDSILIVLGVALAYQAGVFLTNPITLAGRYYCGLLLSAAIVGLAATPSVWMLFIAIFLLSAGLQGIREKALNDNSVGTLTKRSARIMGFCSSGVFGPVTLVVIPLLVLAAAIILGTETQKGDRIQVRSSRGLGAIGVTMIVHQAHYFTYAYALPMMFLSVFRLNPFQAGLAFAAGWVTYSLAPNILKRYEPIRVLIIGHLGVVGLLLVIFFGGHKLWIVLIAWLLTGFGGGTVFEIRNLAKRWSQIDGTGDLDMWENVGHVVGVSAALLIEIGSLPALTNKTQSVFLLFPTASAFAVATVILISVLAARRMGAQANTARTVELAATTHTLETK